MTQINCIKKYSLKNDELEILKKAIKYDKEPKDKYLKEIYKELIDRPLKLEKEIKLLQNHGILAVGVLLHHRSDRRRVPHILCHLPHHQL